MRNDTTNVLDLLAAQHKEVDQLLEKIEKGKGDKDELFGELANKLAAHATIEEKIFYPTVMKDDTEDMLHEAVEEHLSVKRLLADMLELDSDDEQFDAKLSVLKEQLEHHAHEEEEGELFPKVRKAFSADELAAMGNDCLAMFTDLLERDPARQIPSETDHAAALP